MTSSKYETPDSVRDSFEKVTPMYNRPSPKEQPGTADKQASEVHTGNMSTLSREELDAKLQLVEERLDRKVTDIARAVDELKASNVNTVSALNGAKWWAIGTAIAVLAIFLGTLQWGLSAQKEENARFSSYIRDDVKDVADSVKEIAKSVSEMRIKVESQQLEQKR
ncbi:hypothetical protein ACM7ZN_06090 [Pseudomonas aeruginosa]|uniref:hypothetical protein n=1 Tax=Pseudomonas aeruginosa TaxID=287 RepID=UPI0009A39444|nr:hypothetical protein [Pseudomonas aeruginosa]MCO5370264.1 hypothetical protein [Pseudomonas aeruginosa]MDJ1415770.1 hypothetical protein [Pseudomonas aeruginosa]RUF78489.1 hypothetical protein IPC825_25145 [Pseudomonas aeruginosa]HBO1164871.1 hypothetical protein [Pseudomonas aeruginosa]HCE8408142.1 hypothetical protein [Pseudomonas aeruginosa]